jgi:hypothetical protein
MVSRDLWNDPLMQVKILGEISEAELLLDD